MIYQSEKEIISFINKKFLIHITVFINKLKLSVFVPTEAKFTYSLSGSSLFAVKSGTGEIYVAGNLDYETEPNASILLVFKRSYYVIEYLLCLKFSLS